MQHDARGNVRHVRAVRFRGDARPRVSAISNINGQHVRHPLRPVCSARHPDRRHRAKREGRETITINPSPFTVHRVPFPPIFAPTKILTNKIHTL